MGKVSLPRLQKQLAYREVSHHCLQARKPPNGAADEPPAAEARSADARVGSIRWLCGRERSEREHNQRRSRRAVTRTRSVRVTIGA